MANETGAETLPLSYEIKDGIVFTTAVGKVSHEENIAFLKSWIRDPALPKPTLVCRDSRLLDAADIESHEVGLIAYAGAQIDMPPGSRVAMVVSPDLGYGLSRMFSMSADFPAPIKVFRDIEEAVAWLKSDDVD